MLGKEVNKSRQIIILYKDRLLRFGFELIEDLIQIITVFSCRLQGKRANRTRKMIDDLIKEGDEEIDKGNQSDACT